MNEYFISSHCQYVKGAYGAAIYDLKNNAVFSLNADAAYILDSALSNNATDEMHEFLVELCKRQLLNCSTFGEGTAIAEKGLQLRYVWLELTNRCNCRCIHCYGAFGEPSHKEHSQELALSTWKDLLQQIKNHGGNAIQFIGGEPLLFPDFCELLMYAHDIGIEHIDIFTNGTLLSHEVIKVIKAVRASVRVSLYGFDAQSHEKITQCVQSFSKLDQSLDLLRIEGVPTKIAVVLMEENQDYLEQIISYIKSKGHTYTGFDTVRKVKHSIQSSHAVTDSEILKYRYISEPIFCTSCQEYSNNLYWNSCWYGKFAITSTGDIIPCIFARDKICGNIQSDSLDFIKKSLISYWSITKDKVETCKDCEFRYACDDCRPLAEGETGNIYAKYPRCLYNPYTGTWESMK